MFTGIVREVGMVLALESAGRGARVVVEGPRTARVLELGGSVSVDGACLTVAALDGDAFTADLVAETLARTIWGSRFPGDRVNLEASARIGDPIDGHLVQGHVDGVGVVRRVDRAPSAWTVEIEPPGSLLRLIAEKGSIAVNGVSLTVAGTGADTFTTALIPTTLRETNLGDLEPGSRVNLEADLMARYLARLLEGRNG
jgi:riboflavin synthase